MIVIRRFSIEDAAAVAKLVVSIQRCEYLVDVTLEQQPDLLDVEGYFRRGCGDFWVAVEAPTNQIVGTIGLIDIGGHACALRKMFVAASHRGSPHSTGQRLLDVFNNHCAEVAINRVLLGTTQQMKSAHRFYERNGFQRIDEADLPTCFPRMPVDNVFYQMWRYSKSRQ